MGADNYDELINFASRAPETVSEVAALARMAEGGVVFELGVGTGRVAIPLAQEGCQVHGIESDPAMIEKLKSKPGGELVTCHRGDMSQMEVDIAPDIIVAMFGTFFSLLTQAEQVRCFANAARLLRPSGRFIIEALVPRTSAIEVERSVTPAGMDDDRVVLNVVEKDPVQQTIRNRQVVLSSDGIAFNPIAVRYCWPSELDLMAQMAGMKLRERWSDWGGTPFQTGAPRHISIYASEAG